MKMPPVGLEELFGSSAVKEDAKEEEWQQIPAHLLNENNANS